LESIDEVMRNQRLRWSGPVEQNIVDKATASIGVAKKGAKGPCLLLPQKSWVCLEEKLHFDKKHVNCWVPKWLSAYGSSWEEEVGRNIAREGDNFQFVLQK